MYRRRDCRETEAGVHLHRESEFTGEISDEVCGHEFKVKPAASLDDFFFFQSRLAA